MPNEDNWQGDVLRAMRSGAAQENAQGPDAQGHADPAQGQGYADPAQGQAYADPAQGQYGQQQGQQQAYGVPAQHQAYGATPQQQPGHAPQSGHPQQGAYAGHQEPYQQGAYAGYQEPYQQGAAHPGYQEQQVVAAPVAAQPPHPQQPHAQPQPHQAQAQPQAQPQPQQAAPYTPGTRAPHQTPDSRPVVDRGLAGVGRKARRGEPFAARAARALRVSVSSSAAREVARTTATAETLQQPVTTGRQIAVTSIRGGAGKSTVAALLGTTYAHYRQDPVLLVEADPALGSLPLRLGAESLRWTTGDLAGIIEPQMSLLDITGYLVQLPGNAWLLPGSQGQIGAMLDSRAYERVMVSLRRYFGVTVVDCETLPAEVARVALSAAQARVLAAPATLEGVTSTYAVLTWMQSLPRQVIAGTVVVLSELVPHPGLDLGQAVEKLKATGASVQVLPYDRHLAAGGEIRTDLLAHATREGATQLAADVFRLSQQYH
ncbi:MinD/ParA family protein [Streptomyces sp. NPDC058195]|uniref:MinD/ParA family ATP-binding protein n=1 Tax=Streptomyces sp. NPDC058195 TaxID=3346375 RepID=UPI0036EA16D8